MTPFQAVILGLVQALTEFLPVSSSGHLILVPRLLGWADQGLEFDIATNTGTLLAVLIYFRADLARLLRGFVASLGRGGFTFVGVPPAEAPSAHDRVLSWALIVGTIPAAVAGLFAKHWIETWARSPVLIACTAIFYGTLLFVADRSARDTRDLATLGLREGFLIGCAQALALVPGTSRSGITMTAALLLGFRRDVAARFSFLLAVPVGILVGGKQLFDAARGKPLGVPGEAIAIGIAVSAIAGYAVVSWLLGWVRRHSLAPFAWYRWALGLLLLFLYLR